MIPKSDESDSVSHADRPTVEEQIELEALAGSLKIKTHMRDRMRILLIASGAGSRVTGRGAARPATSRSGGLDEDVAI
jgi:hypothetical protein